MGLSTPSTTCDRTAPTATSEASGPKCMAVLRLEMLELLHPEVLVSHGRKQFPLHLSI